MEVTKLLASPEELKFYVAGLDSDQDQIEQHCINIVGSFRAIHRRLALIALPMSYTPPNLNSELYKHYDAVLQKGADMRDIAEPLLVTAFRAFQTRNIKLAMDAGFMDFRFSLPCKPDATKRHNDFVSVIAEQLLDAVDFHTAWYQLKDVMNPHHTKEALHEKALKNRDLPLDVTGEILSYAGRVAEIVSLPDKPWPVRALQMLDRYTSAFHAPRKPYGVVDYALNSGQLGP